MNGYNYKVVAVLKADLSENERLSAVSEIKGILTSEAGLGKERRKVTKRRKGRYLLQGLLLVLAVLAVTLAALAADNMATMMQLEKTEGSVNILDSKEKTVPLIQRMRLYHGYQLGTLEESYAWINLDRDKLVKLDAASEAGIRKKGKKLEVLLDSGNLFFNVSKPLEDDESLTIRTSTMAVGIRGTCGWVEIMDEDSVRVTVLEGTVTVSVTDPVTGEVKTESISGGETAVCMVYGADKDSVRCGIIRSQCTKEEVRGFVLMELFPDSPLREKIYEESGIDLRDLTGEEAGRRLREDGEGLRARLVEIADAQKNQEESVSVVQVWADHGGESPGRSALGTPADLRLTGTTGMPGTSDAPGISGTPNTPGTQSPAVRQVMMPLTDVQVQAEINHYPNVSIQKNPAYADNGTENTLLIDSGLTIPAGKTLTVESGIRTNVSSSRSLQVDGTMDIRGSLDNRGLITVTSSDTLRVGRELFNRGSLTVPAAGRVVAEGSFVSEGTLSLTQGAVIQARSFDLPRPVKGWTVSKMMDSQGYYCLVYNGEDPEYYTVTFDANGGNLAGGTNPLWKVGAGKLLGTLPEDPSRAEYRFSGWYTEGGTKVSGNTLVNGDMTVYARWSKTGWFYDRETKTLTITGSGDMEDYHYIYDTGSWDAPWSDYRTEIAAVVLEEGITRIGSSSFYNCSSLASVTVSSGLTSVGDYAFRGCSSLAEVTLPSGVTDIGNYAFRGCSSLTEITVPSGVTGIGDFVFAECSSLGNIRLLSGVMSIGNGAFYGCSSLTGIELPSGVTSIGDMTFSDCSKLTDIALPSGVKSIGKYAFSACSSLPGIEIPSGVTSIGDGAFSECISLPGIEIPSGVTSIGEGAFYGCSGLASRIVIPSGVTDIGNYVFSGCSSLPGIEIPSGVTGIGDYAFESCSSLTSIRLPSGVRSIGLFAFSGCSSLTNITVPASVTSVGDKIFMWCDKLADVYFGGAKEKWDSLNVETDEKTVIHYSGTGTSN